MRFSKATFFLVCAIGASNTKVQVSASCYVDGEIRGNCYRPEGSEQPFQRGACDLDAEAARGMEFHESGFGAIWVNGEKGNLNARDCSFKPLIPQCTVDGTEGYAKMLGWMPDQLSYDLSKAFSEGQGDIVGMPGETISVNGEDFALKLDNAENPYDSRSCALAKTCAILGEGHKDPAMEQCVRAADSTGDFSSNGCSKGSTTGFVFASPSTTVYVDGVIGYLLDDCTFMKYPEPGDVPMEPPAEITELGPEPTTSLGDPTGFGDPHFKTWSGETFDFHGGCDLVLVTSPSFFNGLGLNIHIRTKIKTWWSFIESAVVQLGENTLEVHGSEKGAVYYFNAEQEGHELVTGEAALGDFHVKFVRISDHQGRARIDLGGGNAISVETFKHFVRVNIKSKTIDKFSGSAGLLGTYPGGKMAARDSITIIEDANEFGFEWQVRPSEGMLFHDLGEVQSPQKCAMPDVAANSRRRLSESLISESEAAAACAHVGENYREMCVFDVMAANDKDLAGSY